MKKILLGTAFLSMLNFVYADGAGGLAGSGVIEVRGGEEIYNASCAGCHMPDGRGAVGAGFYPALKDNPKLQQAAYPSIVVLYGLHGMPALGGILDDEQIANVVNYVRTNFNGVKETITAKDVAPMRVADYDYNDLN
ncbi:c-type cytochrome [Wohlfahrtiimonas larvae]|uniref:Cytochrome c domain-containing protein n=1 Tax=Wohlfahrtiimonas larvae TaxID=1157986 RepID=A0ABP9MR03_9GAMM|nr:cytochrome c [Wohlfahrtiimonas larvae]